VKREARIIMGDYFKQEHIEKYPELVGLIQGIMQTASKTRANVDVAAAEQLLGLTNRFAEIFWETKGVATKKQGSNMAAGGEYVVPA
jgi:nickel superoxide dismutase